MMGACICSPIMYNKNMNLFTQVNLLQLSHCTEELDSLVSLSLSLLKGQEPNPTMLFGSDCKLVT